MKREFGFFIVLTGLMLLVACSSGESSSGSPRIDIVDMVLTANGSTKADMYIEVCERNLGDRRANAPGLQITVSENEGWDDFASSQSGVYDWDDSRDIDLINTPGTTHDPSIPPDWLEASGNDCYEVTLREVFRGVDSWSEDVCPFDEITIYAQYPWTGNTIAKGERSFDCSVPQGVETVVEEREVASELPQFSDEESESESASLETDCEGGDAVLHLVNDLDEDRIYNMHVISDDYEGDSIGPQILGMNDLQPGETKSIKNLDEGYWHIRIIGDEVDPNIRNDGVDGTDWGLWSYVYLCGEEEIFVSELAGCNFNPKAEESDHQCSPFRYWE